MLLDLVREMLGELGVRRPLALLGWVFDEGWAAANRERAMRSAICETHSEPSASGRPSTKGSRRPAAVTTSRERGSQPAWRG